VRCAKTNQSLYACVTDAKGRIAGDVFIHADGESLLIDAELGLRETLEMRLERYIVADDVVLEDVTESYVLWHVFKATAGDGVAVGARRLDEDGVDLWLPVGARFQPEPPTLSEDDFEAYRILHGIPRWPNELGGDVFPQEAGLEARAMSFTKGCYIGQEILSRIKSTGKMPRELVQWLASEKAGQHAIAAGDELFLEGKVIGRVTSVTLHPVLGRLTGLAFVKQGAVRMDSILLAGKGEPSIEASVDISAFVK
jgi:folate-binding protein YgfZ